MKTKKYIAKKRLEQGQVVTDKDVRPVKWHDKFRLWFRRIFY